MSCPHEGIVPQVLPHISGPERTKMDMFIWGLLTLVGAWLGWSVSMDWSNHPAFPLGSYAFVAFWTVFGMAAGWVAGLKVSRWLYRLELFG